MINNKALLTYFSLALVILDSQSDLGLQVNRAEYLTLIGGDINFDLCY